MKMYIRYVCVCVRERERERGRERAREDLKDCLTLFKPVQDELTFVKMPKLKTFLKSLHSLFCKSIFQSEHLKS